MREQRLREEPPQLRVARAAARGAERAERLCTERRSQSVSQPASLQSVSAPRADQSELARTRRRPRRTLLQSDMRASVR